MKKNSALIYIIILASFFYSVTALANKHYQISLSGIQGDILQNVNAQLKVEQASLGVEPKETKLTHFIERLPSVLQHAMEPYGYFQPDIQTRVQRTPDKWLITIHVRPGRVTQITKLQVAVKGEGKHEALLASYLAHLPLQEGNVFRADVYTKVKEDLLKIANSKGYIKAYIEQNKIIISRRHASAQIILVFNTGPLFYFGKVSFNQGPYAQSFLQRFVTIKPTMPFSSEKLVQLQQEMQRSYYFDKVAVTPNFVSATDAHIPITITVIPHKAKKYAFGLGYGTYTGFRLTGALSLRRLGDKGHHFDAELKLSKVLSNIGLKYYIPGSKPLSDQWIIGASYQRFHPENGDSNSVTVSGGYLHKFDHVQVNSNINYLADRYRLYSTNDPDSHFSKLLYPSINLTYLRSDDVLNPTWGRYGMLNLQGATTYLLSSNDFVQAEAKTKLLFSPTSFSKIILRGDIGYTVADNLEHLPLSMRFFAGGLNSVRGYYDSSIGPGRYLVVGSIEYQNHIQGNWDGAVFYDAGNAMEHWGERLNRGVGVGIIYRSMIGPIKVYIGQALDKSGKPKSVEFSIGPEF